MSMLVKFLIGLAVALPVAAFVVGSLVVASDDSPPRERIVIEDDSSPVGDDREQGEPGRDKEPARKPSVDADEDDAEDGPEGDDDSSRPGATDNAAFGLVATDDGLGPDHSGGRARVPGGSGGADDDGERDDDSNTGHSGDDSGGGDD